MPGTGSNTGMNETEPEKKIERDAANQTDFCIDLKKKKSEKIEKYLHRLLPSVDGYRFCFLFYYSLFYFHSILWLCASGLPPPRKCQAKQPHNTL